MKRKLTLFTFSRGDFKSLEHYLNEQAEKGWELEKTGILARWKRTERTDLTYSVDLAKPKQDREDRLDYMELCREAGWELTALTGQMYIFKSQPGAELVPIHTDPELERKQYNKYYIRNTILGVVFLMLYFGFWLALGSAMGSNWVAALSELKDGWLISWVAVGILCAMPFWGVWSVWKLIDFIRATVKGRTGTIGESPRWVMWLNNILAFAAGIGAILFFAGDILELLLAEKVNITILILLLIWGGALLYQALAIEKELFRRERRRYIAVGIGALVMFAVLIAGRLLLPYGVWSTHWFSSDKETAAEIYEQSFQHPLVHGEDVGLSLEEDETVRISRQYLPIGECWQLEYYYNEEKNPRGFTGVGSYTVASPFEWLAGETVRALAEGLEKNRHDPWPADGLKPIKLSWADEAWYGEVHHEDEARIAILVLRAGKRVTRLTFPADLLSGENQSIIRAELEN